MASSVVVMLGMSAVALVGVAMVVVGLVIWRRGRRAASPSPETRLSVAVLLGVGGLLIPLGVALAVFLPPGLRSHDAMLEAALEFLEVVRGGDRDAILQKAAPGAELDEAYLREVVAPSRDSHMGSSVSGMEEGCLRLSVLPSKRQLVLAFVKRSDRWAVQFAAEHHAECENSLDAP